MRQRGRQWQRRRLRRLLLHQPYARLWRCRPPRPLAHRPAGRNPLPRAGQPERRERRLRGRLRRQPGRRRGCCLRRAHDGRLCCTHRLPGHHRRHQRARPYRLRQRRLRDCLWRRWRDRRRCTRRDHLQRHRRPRLLHPCGGRARHRGPLPARGCARCRRHGARRCHRQRTLPQRHQHPDRAHRQRRRAGCGQHRGLRDRDDGGRGQRLRRHPAHQRAEPHRHLRAQQPLLQRHERLLDQRRTDRRARQHRHRPRGRRHRPGWQRECALRHRGAPLHRAHGRCLRRHLRPDPAAHRLHGAPGLHPAVERYLHLRCGPRALACQRHGHPRRPDHRLGPPHRLRHQRRRDPLPRRVLHGQQWPPRPDRGQPFGHAPRPGQLRCHLPAHGRQRLPHRNPDPLRRHRPARARLQPAPGCACRLRRPHRRSALRPVGRRKPLRHGPLLPAEAGWWHCLRRSLGPCLHRLLGRHHRPWRCLLRSRQRLRRRWRPDQPHRHLELCWRWHGQRRLPALRLHLPEVWQLHLRGVGARLGHLHGLGQQRQRDLLALHRRGAARRPGCLVRPRRHCLPRQRLRLRPRSVLRAHRGAGPHLLQLLAHRP